MIKTINGKKYDTEKSIVIWAYQSEFGTKNPCWFSEALYRLPRGGWFIEGCGGRLSPYSRGGAGGRVPGHKITPLTHKEALDWLTNHDQGHLAQLHKKR